MFTEFDMCPQQELRKQTAETERLNKKVMKKLLSNFEGSSKISRPRFNGIDNNILPNNLMQLT